VVAGSAESEDHHMIDRRQWDPWAPPPAPVPEPEPAPVAQPASEPDQQQPGADQSLFNVHTDVDLGATVELPESLESLSKAALQELAETLGLATSGTKTQLIDRIRGLLG